jgi:uncharacterized protein (TIGR02996 family)
MMDHDVFLQAILTQPDEDLPRLIYADWLEEQGDIARAEFIRVQCALAPMERTDPGRRELAAREIDLLAENGGRWRAELPALPAGLVWQDFARGFASVLLVRNIEVLTVVAQSLFAQFPIQHLKCMYFGNRDLEKLQALPELRHLRSLAFHWAFDAERGLAKLVRSPWLRELRSLGIWTSAFKDREVETLCKAADLPQLAQLVLSGNQVGNKGVESLTKAPMSHQWTELILDRNQISGPGVRTLLKAEQLDHLQLLDLRYNDIVEPARSQLRARFGKRVLLEEPRPTQ